MGVAKLTVANGRKPRKSLKVESDDEFVFDAAEDEALGESAVEGRL